MNDYTRYSDVALSREIERRVPGRMMPNCATSERAMLHLAGQSELTGRWTFRGISSDLEDGVGVVWEAGFTDQGYPHSQVVTHRDVEPARAIAVAWLLMDDAVREVRG